MTVNSGGSTIVTYTPSAAYVWGNATGQLLGGWSGTTHNRIRIGHSLFALLAAWFGGVLSRRLGRVPVAPEVPMEERAVG